MPSSSAGSGAAGEASRRASSASSSSASSASSASRRRRSGDQQPEWVPDRESKACTACARSFGLARRRHHCRACGHVFCDSCSSKERELPFSGGKAVRVCDACFDDDDGDEKAAFGSAISGGGRGVSVRHEGGEGGAQRDPRMEPPSLSPWLYVFKPLSEAGRSLPIGRLLVRVVEGADLPAMDIRTSDPYCTVHVGEEAPGRPATTSVKHLTLNPKWDEEFILPVLNATSPLYVRVWDHDRTGQNDLIGTVRVPLESISHQARFESWYDLALDPRAAAKLGSKRAADAPPAVRLELQYTFSKVGELFSHFVPDLPPAPPADEFDTNRLYGEFFRFLENVQPVFDLIFAVNVVLGWERPLLSLTVTAAFLAVVWHPWALPVLLQLLLLRHLAWNFVYREWRTARAREAAAIRAAAAAAADAEDDADDGFSVPGAAKARALVGKLGRTFRVTGPAATTGEQGVEPPPEDKKMYELNGMMTRMINASLDLAGWEEWLAWYQNLFAWLSDMIEWTASLFDWSSRGTSAAVAAVLVATTAYSALVTFQHIALVAGLYVLCAWTLPVQAVQWFVAGAARYFGRARVRKAIRRKRARRWQKVATGAKALGKLRSKGKAATAAAAAAAAAAKDKEA